MNCWVCSLICCLCMVWLCLSCLMLCLRIGLWVLGFNYFGCGWLLYLVFVDWCWIMVWVIVWLLYGWTWLFGFLVNSVVDFLRSFMICTCFVWFGCLFGVDLVAIGLGLGGVAFGWVGFVIWFDLCCCCLRVFCGWVVWVLHIDAVVCCFGLCLYVSFV